MKPTIGDSASASIYDLDPAILDDELRKDVLACISVQKIAAEPAMAKYVPSKDALDYLSLEHLSSLVESETDVHGIATDSSISNVIHFGASHLEDSVNDLQVYKLRKSVDSKLARLLETVFDSRHSLKVVSSGHFWYPKGSYMSWHTNSRVPGWRVYINYAEEEGKSFFRYRDPTSHEVITLQDKHWNLRMFPIRQDIPFWHCIYSNTNRFSLGYLVTEQSLRTRIKARLRRTFKK